MLLENGEKEKSWGRRGQPKQFWKHGVGSNDEWGCCQCGGTWGIAKSAQALRWGSPVAVRAVGGRDQRHYTKDNSVGVSRCQRSEPKNIWGSQATANGGNILPIYGSGIYPTKFPHWPWPLAPWHMGSVPNAEMPMDGYVPVLLLQNYTISGPSTNFSAQVNTPINFTHLIFMSHENNVAFFRIVFVWENYKDNTMILSS